MYLFPNFLKAFRRTFVFPNWDNKNQHSYYNWDDPVYSNFMMELMYALEPIHTSANTILFNELEEVDEVLFYIKGIHEIGYELNSEKVFVLRYENSNPLGAYSVTFD